LQAQRRIAQAVALSEELGHPFSHVFALYHDNFLKQQCRQGPETLAGGELLQSLAEEQGFPFWAALGMLTRGIGLLLQTSCDEAIDWLQEGLNSLRRTGANIVVPHYTLRLSEAHCQAGRYREAFLILDEASTLIDRSKELFNEAELYRIRGDLLVAHAGEGDPTPAIEAESSYHKARSIARRQRSRALELRASISLARLRCQQGRSNEARDILAPVYSSFTEGLDTADLQDARSLLDATAEGL
jgi:predicted ATPase